MRRPKASPLIFVSALFAAMGCGSGGTTTPNPGSITLSLSPTSASIQQGGTASVTGTIVRTNFTGDVTIAVSGVPTGVTGVVVQSPVNGSNSAQVDITAATTTATGTYPITVTASGSGISSATATYTLTITALPSSFTLAVSPTSPTVVQGGSTVLTGTVTRLNFPGDIAISVTGAPTGVTTTVTQSPVSGGNTATINVAVANSATPGPSTLTITANGGGTAIATSTVQLLVAVTGSFTIAAGNNALDVVQGNTITTSITVARTGGFGGTPLYTVAGPAGAALPSGLAAAVTPTGTTDQNTLTVTTTLALAPGTYPVVVTATAFGNLATATVNVTVTLLGVVHLDFSQCNATVKPIWVGYQDGSAPFVHVAGTGDVYTFTVASPKAALATVSSNGASGFSTTVQYFTKAELAVFTGSCVPVPMGGKTITGSTTGIVSPNNPEISMGGATAFTLVSSPNFQLTNVPSGVLDLIAYNPVHQFALSASDQVLIHRDLNIAGGGSVGALNFATEGVTVVPAMITVTGGATTYFATMNYLSGAACISNQINSLTNSAASPLAAYGVPASLQRASDYHNLLLQHNNGQADFRTVSTSFHVMADKTIAIGAGVGPLSVTPTVGGYLQETASFTLAPDYTSAAFRYQTNGGTFNAMTLNQSAAWLGGNNAVVLGAPDLSTVAGYQTSWGPANAGALNYSVTVTSTPPATMCAEGATLRTATAGTGSAVRQQ